jgi:hypothetical protein
MVLLSLYILDDQGSTFGRDSTIFSEYQILSKYAYEYKVVCFLF